MLDIDKVYALCNKLRWFTSGSVEQYEKMFNMIRAGYGVEKVAVAIYICSSDVELADIVQELYMSMKTEL